MGLDIDRLIGYGDDFGVSYNPHKMFKIGFDKLRKRGKLPKHPHKGFRAAFKNSVNKHPPYMKEQWDDEVEELSEQDLDWYYEEPESLYDLPDFSYPDYKPTFGLKDRLGGVGDESEEGYDIGEDPACRQVGDQAKEPLQSAEMMDSMNKQKNIDSSNQESWFSNLFHNLF